MMGWPQVYKRLQEIDAYGAEARAATILAGLSFDNSMQVSSPPSAQHNNVKSASCCSFDCFDNTKASTCRGRQAYAGLSVALRSCIMEDV